MGPARRVYGLAAIGMAAVGFVFHDFTPLIRQAPGHAPHEGLVALRYALMLVGGIALNLGRGRIARAGALILAADFAAWAAIAVGPDLVSGWRTWVNWEDLAEQTAMALGGVLAWSRLSPDRTRDRVGQAARLLFGLCLVVFGISDVVYLAHTAAMVPAWLPPSQVVWTWVACLAHVAAGLAVLSGVLARLAARLVVAMYALFAVLVHLPVVLGQPHVAGHWVEQGANFILLGAAWCLAEWLGQSPVRRSNFPVIPAGAKRRAGSQERL